MRDAAGMAADRGVRPRLPPGPLNWHAPQQSDAKRRRYLSAMYLAAICQRVWPERVSAHVWPRSVCPREAMAPEAVSAIEAVTAM